MSFIYSNIQYKAKSAFVAALIVSVVGLFSFMMFEPVIGTAQTSNPHDFIVTQSITEEISFLVEAADVTMDGSIAGITGGYATGTTYAVVQTNDPDGYNMTLNFSADPAMQANATGSVIDNYTPASAGTPDYDFIANGAGGAAEFAYTVQASSTGDIDTKFVDNGTACGAGSNETVNKCWYNPSTTPETIVNRATAADLGATTTITFKVAVPNNPSPALEADTYTATGTLTATNNP